jgi:hypothetical protein
MFDDLLGVLAIEEKQSRGIGFHPATLLIGKGVFRDKPLAMGGAENLLGTATQTRSRVGDNPARQPTTVFVGIARADRCQRLVGAEKPYKVLSGLGEVDGGLLLYVGPAGNVLVKENRKRQGGFRGCGSAGRDQVCGNQFRVDPLVKVAELGGGFGVEAGVGYFSLNQPL